MRNILFVFAICFSFLLSAECSRQDAGNVLRPGTGLGHVVFVNAQARLDHREIVSVAKRISESAELEVNAIVAKDTDPQTLLKTANAQAVVVIRDNATDPAMLIAPEDRWAIVNVAKLVGDLPSERAKQKFFVPRARKEVLRAFSLLCGGGSSQFPGNVMNAATLRETDRIEERIPADLISRYVDYLKQIGVTQKDLVPYEFACEEGWAPAPTNDVQKAIWEKVHTPPTKPIKITYDKAAQKPVVK